MTIGFHNAIESSDVRRRPEELGRFGGTGGIVGLGSGSVYEESKPGPIFAGCVLGSFVEALAVAVVEIPARQTRRILHEGEKASGRY